MGDLLGRIAAGRREERTVLLGQLRQRGVDAGASLVTPERARAVFFVLDGRKLRPAAWAGRPEPPREELAGDDAGGDAAFDLVERHDRILVPDTRAPEAVDFALGGEYRTYLSVAVYAGQKNFGMLSVDAPEPESLEESDLDITTALAQTLGAGLAMA
jgi:GAF domain-containing protein